MEEETKDVRKVDERPSPCGRALKEGNLTPAHLLDLYLEGRIRSSGAEIDGQQCEE